MVRAVRGAIGVEKNEREAIHCAARRMVHEILTRNGIGEEEIVSILFSLTRDLSSGNPAAGLRVHGFADTPLFCVQEAEVEGAPPRILRVLLTYEAHENRRPIPVYLDAAAALRPDLSERSE